MIIVIKFVGDVIGIGALYLLLGMMFVKLGIEDKYLEVYIELGFYSVILLSLLMFTVRLFSGQK